MKVDQVQEGWGPELSWEARSIKQGACSYAKFVVVDFNGTILGGAVGSSGLNCVVKVPEQSIFKLMASGELATLVCTDAAAVLMAIVVKEFFDDIVRRVFWASEEEPYILCSFIDDHKVRGVTVIG
jgi:hypothetical protein